MESSHKNNAFSQKGHYVYMKPFPELYQLIFMYGCAFSLNPQA